MGWPCTILDGFTMVTDFNLFAAAQAGLCLLLQKI